MRLHVIRRKASSLKELGRETVEIPKVSSLRELLSVFTAYEFERQHEKRELTAIGQEEIEQQAGLGRVKFAEMYNTEKGDRDEAVRVMLQDYEDGLFRVYRNGEECAGLDEPLEIKDEDEIVFVRLVMLAGRLW